MIAPDGTVHLIQEGEIVETRTPEGTITRYEDGLIISQEYPSGDLISRTYLKDSSGRIKEERRSDNTVLSYTYTYDAGGNIVNIYTTDQNGKTSFYDSSYNLISISEGDIVTHYNKGRVYLVTDKNDIPLIEYIYDQEGDLYEIKSAGLYSQLAEKIRLGHDEILSQYNTTYESIFKEVSSRLSEIAFSVGEAYKPVNDYHRQIQELWASNSPHMSRDVHDQLTSMFDEVTRESNRILSEKLSAYREVEKNKLSAITALVENKDTSLLNLSQESIELRDRLYIQEVLGIVPNYYASILGRCPDEDELSFWLGEFKSSGVLTAASIRDYLYALPEYKMRLAFQKEVIEGVRLWLSNYISLSPQERQTLLASLNLTSSEADSVWQALISRDITSQELKRILRMFEEENLHFVSSAVESLRKLFEDAGISYDLKTLTIEALLIDILAGKISSLNQEDLKLSLYSLSRIARKYGLDCGPCRYFPSCHGPH